MRELVDETVGCVGGDRGKVGDLRAEFAARKSPSDERSSHGLANRSYHRAKVAQHLFGMVGGRLIERGLQVWVIDDLDLLLVVRGDARRGIGHVIMLARPTGPRQVQGTECGMCLSKCAASSSLAAPIRAGSS